MNFPELIWVVNARLHPHYTPVYCPTIGVEAVITGQVHQVGELPQLQRPGMGWRKDPFDWLFDHALDGRTETMFVSTFDVRIVARLCDNSQRVGSHCTSGYEYLRLL